MEVRLFFDNGDLEKIVSDYLGISKQYFNEEFSNYLETIGSYPIAEEDLLNNGLSYNDIPVKGFMIESIDNKYEIVPVAVIDNWENLEVLYSLLMVIKLP